MLRSPLTSHENAKPVSSYLLLGNTYLKLDARQKSGSAQTHTKPHTPRAHGLTLRPSEQRAEVNTLVALKRSLVSLFNDSAIPR